MDGKELDTKMIKLSVGRKKIQSKIYSEIMRMFIVKYSKDGQRR